MMKKNAVIFMGKRSVAIAILLVITSTIFISVASAATTTYDYSSGATTNKWAWEVVWDKVPPVIPTVETVTPLTPEQYGWISTPNDVRWQMSDPGHSNYISMKSTIDIQESAASITNILFHGEAYKTGNQPRVVRVYGYNQDTSVWDLIGSGTVPASPPDGTVEASLTADFDQYIEADGKLTWCFFLDRQGRTLYLDYIKVDVTYTSISGVATDKLTYKVGETITTTWTSADGFGSGESYINVEYWDATAGTQFDLKSYATSATSSTSEALTSSEVGHEINVYVYTTSDSTGDRLTAITQGDPWPYPIVNAIQSASWNSYNDAAHNNPDDTFSGDEHTVYMHGTGFTVSHDYKVAYYDADNYKVATDTTASDSDGHLSSQYYFPTNMSAVAGLGHFVVYDATDSPPSTYNPDDPDTIADDSFTVEQSAIPEFPTVIAAIAVCMLCAISYIFMRRKVIYGK